MSRAHTNAAVILVLLTVAGLFYTAVSGNRPLLGLDLQGGVSVVFQPRVEAGAPPPSPESLDQAVSIIRDRVDAIGVAEPEISRQGNTIVVDLPGVNEQQRVLDLVGQTAELRFRAVIDSFFLPELNHPGLDPEDLDLDGLDLEGLDLEGLDLGGDGTDSPAGTDEQNGAGEPEGDDEEGMARFRRATEPEPDPEPSPDADADADADAEVDIPAEEPIVRTPAEQEMHDAAMAACGTFQTTSRDDDLADAYVFLPGQDGRFYCLGPTLMTGGESLESADVGLGIEGWFVSPIFKPGSQGIDAFNVVASFCFNRHSVMCPTGYLAIVMDQQVISAPEIRAPSFARDSIQISGAFDETGARNLAVALNYGALPVELEAQQVRTVSATVGDDVLVAGLISGLIGIAGIGIYLLWYYRLAGLVAIAGLVLSFALLWTIISWLGATQGLAITLAGVVGLIVSIGVTTDSNIVYFETVKEVAAGPSSRRLTTSVERAYHIAISTIVKAGVVSLIAAVLLYWLTVGAVRGFALYLGLATLIDLVVSWIFMRPALAWIAARNAVQANPALIGIRAGDGRGAA